MIRTISSFGIVVSLLLLSTSCNEDRLVRPIGIAVHGVKPAGGLPGATIEVLGYQFRPVPEENTVTVNGLPAKVLSASDTLLTVQIPEQADFAEGMLIVKSAGLLPDTTRIIVSDTPLAEVTGLRSVAGPPETVVTVLGKNFVPDSAANFILYEKPDGTFFIPTNPDNTFRNTLQMVYPDSLLIQIPDEFRKGRLRIVTKTTGEPNGVPYELMTPIFTVE